MRLLVIACGGRKAKGRGARRAIDLYTGRQFALARRLMAKGWDVLILSAKHGLIPADTRIARYDETLTKAKADELAASEYQAHRLRVWGETAPTILFYGGVLYERVFGALVERAGLARAGDRRDVVNIIGRGCGDHYSVLKEIVATS